MPVADTDRRSLRKAEAQVETGKCYCCGLSTCLLCFCIQLFWAWALSLELKQASQAGCCAGCSHWEAHMGQPVLWETGTPTHKPAPAADSLAVGTLLNTKAPQFPHPLKKKKEAPFTKCFVLRPRTLWFGKAGQQSVGCLLCSAFHAAGTNCCYLHVHLASHTSLSVAYLGKCAATCVLGVLPAMPCTSGCQRTASRQAEEGASSCTGSSQ